MRAGARPAGVGARGRRGRRWPAAWRACTGAGTIAK